MKQPFNFEESVVYCEDKKRAFHRHSRRALQTVAAELGLPAGTYELRSNKAGPACSGEITLHGERVFIQVSQPCCHEGGVLIRRCAGRRDYSGGPNHFASLKKLNEPRVLAGIVQQICFRN